MRERRAPHAMLRAVLRLDAVASAVMPLLLLGAVPLVAAVDAPAGLVGLVMLAYAVLLGASGAVIAGLLVVASVRGELDVGTSAWRSLALRP